MRCTAASASQTGTPCPSNMAAVVDLPIPIDPVRPMIVRVITGPRAQLVIHGRRVAEPALEPRNRLMQQHAEPIHGLASEFFRIFRSCVRKGV
jgi:hypothetical protein